MNKLEQIKSVQNWLPFDKILDKGIIKMKDSSYIKIMSISPINYVLKSSLEKEAILNSYKNVFKSCNFNLQIFIQSQKEDLSNHINKIKEKNLYPEISEKYIKYINNFIKSKKSSNKKFYLIIKSSHLEENEAVKIQNLGNNYFKLKDLFSRCGNLVSEITEDKKIIEILHSLFNFDKT